MTRNGVRESRRRLLKRVATTATLAGFGGCLGDNRSPEERANEHAEALERYEDVSAALRDGYESTFRYVEEADGGYGVPFINRSVEPLEPTSPQILLYDLTADGRYELAGAEWYVPADEADEPPELFGRRFHEPTDAHGADEPDVYGPPGPPRHYGLHAWLFESNPEGTFATYNPNVEAPAFVPEITAAREALSPIAVGFEAEERGYENTEKCIDADAGGYGVPFVRADGEPLSTTDPRLLLYRLTPNWSYELMGAEWYVPVEEVDGPPELFGQRFHESTDGHSPRHEQPEHYGLHAWLFAVNPEGLFAPYNPAFEC